MALWDPSNYTAGLLKDWHDPSNSANITQSGGLITADADLSGGSSNVAAGAPRPTYSTAAINSLNAETLTASVPQYFTGGFNYSTLSNMGVIWVVQRAATSTFKTLIGSANNGGLQWRITNTQTLALVRQATANVTAGTGTVPTTTSIVAFTHTPATGPYSFRIDGTTGGSGSVTATYANSSSTVGVNPASSEYFDGIIGERIAIAGVTLSDVQLAEGYLAWKWGTVSTLDASHPYKSAAPTVGGGTSPFIFPRNRHYVRR